MIVPESSVQVRAVVLERQWIVFDNVTAGTVIVIVVNAHVECTSVVLMLDKKTLFGHGCV